VLIQIEFSLKFICGVLSQSPPTITENRKNKNTKAPEHPLTLPCKQMKIEKRDFFVSGLVIFSQQVVL
jgi:hypothetical protein